MKTEIELIMRDGVAEERSGAAKVTPRAVQFKHFEE
jgi:hypothetical protein